MKKIIQRTGLYEYLKYSRLFRVYERLLKPAAGAAHAREVRLYQSILGEGAKLIFDIGAYDGHKTAAFLELCDSVVVCEPDAHNFRLLGIRFRRQRRRVSLYRTALAEQAGTAVFHVHHPGSAFNTLNPAWAALLEADHMTRWNEEIRFQQESDVEVATTTLDELIRLHGMPDFIKIDVEGFERLVMAGLSRSVPCLSFECLLPEFKDDLLEILRRLMDLEARTAFNVVYEEELLFPEFVSYERVLEWIGTTTLYAFDMVARTI